MRNAAGLRRDYGGLAWKEVTETDKIRRLAIAIHALQTILRLLEREGAQTRP